MAGSDSGDTQARGYSGQASGDLSPQAAQKSSFSYVFTSPAKEARVKNNRLTLAATCAGQPHPSLRDSCSSSGPAWDILGTLSPLTSHPQGGGGGCPLNPCPLRRSEMGIEQKRAGELRPPCSASCKTDTDIFTSLSLQAQSLKPQDGGVSGTQCDLPPSLQSPHHCLGPISPHPL